MVIFVNDSLQTVEIITYASFNLGLMVNFDFVKVTVSPYQSVSVPTTINRSHNLLVKTSQNSICIGVIYYY